MRVLVYVCVLDCVCVCVLARAPVSIFEEKKGFSLFAGFGEERVWRVRARRHAWRSSEPVNYDRDPTHVQCCH